MTASIVRSSPGIGEVLLEARLRARTKVEDIHLDGALAVPFVEPGSESDAASALIGKQFVGALGEPERDCAHCGRTLPDAEAQVPLSAADFARLACHLQIGGEK